MILQIYKGCDILVPFYCNSFAYVFSTTLIRIDLVSRLSTDVGTFTPNSTFNAVGYNSLDGYMYDYNIDTNRVVKLGGDMISQDLPSIPNLPTLSYNIGDVSNGYLYLNQGQSLTFYVVDVNPLRGTYLNIVNPSTKLLTTTGTTMSGATVSSTAIGAADWAFNPIDGQLYYMRNSDGIIRRMNPSTGFVTALNHTTTPLPGVYGSLFFGPTGELYSIDNTSGDIYKYIINGNNATRSFLSSIGAISTGDGARCASAPLYFATLEDLPIKSSTSYTHLGDEIIYTISLENIGNIPAINVFLLDTLASETTFINNSCINNYIKCNFSHLKICRLKLCNY